MLHQPVPPAGHGDTPDTPERCWHRRSGSARANAGPGGLPGPGRGSAGPGEGRCGTAREGSALMREHGPVRGGAAAGAAPGGSRRARIPAVPRGHSLGDLGVEVADPEAVPVLQRALGEDGGVLQRQRLAARLHGCAEGGGGRRRCGGRPGPLSPSPVGPRPLRPRAGLAPPLAPLCDVTLRPAPMTFSGARGAATVSEAVAPALPRPPPLRRPRAPIPGPDSRAPAPDARSSARLSAGHRDQRAGAS